MFGDSYRGYNVRRLIYWVHRTVIWWVQCMETHIGVKIQSMVFHIKNIMYGDWYISSNIWRFI